MATETKESRLKEELQGRTSSGALQTVQKDIKPVQAFITKFNNDWVMNFASGLAFNILTSIFPIFVAIISIFGFVVGGLDPTAKGNLISHIQGVFPQQIQSGNLIETALNSLNRNAGPLAIIAVLLAIFGGSRLFVTLEGYFDIIYHTRPRNVIKQNIMAFVMMLIFIVLIPLIVFGATVPALVFTILRSTPLNNIPGSGVLFFLGGIAVGVIFAWILFEVIYVVVPNQRISIRHSWLGALVAAIAVQLYLSVLFPFYATHFLGSYTGTAGFAVILLFFFYYFAVILLLGAEVNAFFSEKIRATPSDLATMVHDLTSHLPTSEKDIQEQASVSHKNVEPKAILPESQASSLKDQAHEHTSTAQVARAQDQASPVSNSGNHKAKKQKSGGSRTGTIIEVLARTALAFLVELFTLRHRK